MFFLLTFAKVNFQLRELHNNPVKHNSIFYMVAINILLNVYEAGIVKQLSQLEKISSTQYSSYVSKLEYDYGMTTESAIEALNAWLDVCIRKGAGTRYGNAIIKAKKESQEATTVPVESAIGVDLNVETIHWLVLHVVTFEIEQSQLTALLVQIKLIGCGLLFEVVIGNQQFLI